MKTITKSTPISLNVITLVLAVLHIVFASPLLESPSDAKPAVRVERGEYEQFGLLAPPLATIYSSCKNNKQVALTFDDGPWVYAYDISKALVAAGAKGTFFWNGNNYGCIYSADEVKRVKYIVDHGHQVASHTWSHRDLTARCSLSFSSIVGKSPAFLRPPYGSYNDLVRQVVKQRNQSLALWDLDSQDSLGATVAQSKAIYRNAVAKNPRNILALNHEPLETTAHQVLPYAIDLLKSKGYQLVTLAECLNLPAYQWEGTLVCLTRRGTAKLHLSLCRAVPSMFNILMR